jgi:hypothetical protein
MAIFTTLFAANDEELSKLFPHWLTPRDTPVTKRGLNPFTGKEMDHFMWVPDEVAERGLTTTEPPFARMPIAPKGSKPIPPIVEPENDYHADLENNVAPLGLRTVPHVVMKGYIVIAPLSKQLGSPGPTRPARVSSTGMAIECMPDEAASKLASTPETELTAMANVWARNDESGDLKDKAIALWTLTRLRLIAQTAVGSSRRVCVYVSV